MTIIFPKSFTASTRLRIPGAETPSSLVMRITGFSLPDLTVAFIFFFGADFRLRRTGLVVLCVVLLFSVVCVCFRCVVLCSVIFCFSVLSPIQR